MDEPRTVEEIERGYEQARQTFRQLIDTASPAALARVSAGTRWTNRQLLFHMLFGYLVTRNLLVLVKIVSRLPERVGRVFAGLLDAGTRPFDLVNYWGSCGGGRLISPPRMIRWMDRVTASLERHLTQESESSLERLMPFPTRWDPYFKTTMTLRDVYHYPTLHFEHHRQQLTTDAASP